MTSLCLCHRLAPLESIWCWIMCWILNNGDSEVRRVHVVSVTQAFSTEKYYIYPWQLFYYHLMAKFTPLEGLIDFKCRNKWELENYCHKWFNSSCPHAGMLALEMLGRRAHNDHPNNFSRSPPYTEDVKWLLSLAARLGNSCHLWHTAFT